MAIYNSVDGAHDGKQGPRDGDDEPQQMGSECRVRRGILPLVVSFQRPCEASTHVPAPPIRCHTELLRHDRTVDAQVAATPIPLAALNQ